MTASRYSYDQAHQAWTQSFHTNDRRAQEEAAASLAALSRQLGRQAKSFLGSHSRYEPWLREARIDLDRLEALGKSSSVRTSRSRSRKRDRGWGMS